ncbi:MAG TPA: hypothetical protein VG713_11970, partial [Pirellulales bacterium]|nr:hypothetical protein [Pirellulales bacterium]
MIVYLWFPMIWAMVLVVFAAHSVSASSKRSMRSSVARLPCWWRVETANFTIYSFGTKPLDAAVAGRCEAMRSALARDWLGAASGEPWRPKCDLVLHNSVAGYLAAVGGGSAHTVGACSIEVVGTTTTVRRIDLRTDVPHWIDNLPHELTHMLMDSRLTSADLPRWID